MLLLDLKTMKPCQINGLGAQVIICNTRGVVTAFKALERLKNKASIYRSLTEVVRFYV
jgi:hypothetical protein